MLHPRPVSLVVLFLLAVFPLPAMLRAEIGDPQLRTDHRWYPGELACSTFDRLFATQAELYEHVTGRRCVSEEDKVLASWLWRNTHYWHGEEGGADLWDAGYGKGGDSRNREYWSGLFAHGFGLCGTTHSQWTAEMQVLLGHGRARGVGTAGHNSFEVFLIGGGYGPGRWAMLDHDLSTVVFSADGSRLLGIGEVAEDWQRLTSREHRPTRERGWLPCGLHPGDGASFSRFAVAEYLAGYAGPPPRVHLRRGETLRRYHLPGLDDRQTFVFWGRNYHPEKIPGPERSRTWVNQPEKMFGSGEGTPHIDGQARYANAVYTYRPDFASNDYLDAVVDRSSEHVTFSFHTPFVIAAAPPNDEPWGIYDSGCKEGLVVSLDKPGTGIDVSVSVDAGASWTEVKRLADSLDLTDAVKGHQQYQLRLAESPDKLTNTGLTIRTVCQVNTAVLPRLTDEGSEVEYRAGGRATVSAGPNLAHARAHLVDGDFGTPRVTLGLKAPGGRPIREIHAAAHVQSGSPPDPQVRYQIEYSLDGGETWLPIQRDWTVKRREDEPQDFWSQSLCWGQRQLDGDQSEALVRFHNDGGKRYARAEVHLVYETSPPAANRITFAWQDDQGEHRWSHTVQGDSASFTVPTGKETSTRWVEFASDAR